MIARAAFAQLRHSALLLTGTTLGLLCAYVLPVGLLLTGDPVAMRFVLLAWVGSAALFRPSVLEYEAPSWTVVALPIIALLYLRATLA